MIIQVGKLAKDHREGKKTVFDVAKEDRLDIAEEANIKSPDNTSGRALSDEELLE